MVELRLPHIPGVIAILDVKAIGDMQPHEFLHKLPGLRIVRLVFRSRPDKHTQIPGPLLFRQYVGGLCRPVSGANTNRSTEPLASTSRSTISTDASQEPIHSLRGSCVLSTLSHCARPSRRSATTWESNVSPDERQQLIERIKEHFAQRHPHRCPDKATEQAERQHDGCCMDQSAFIEQLQVPPGS
jgi:hypothetical protein